MKDILTQIIKTRTLKDAAISFTGTFVNGLLGLAFYILMARNLGPLNFGIFSVAVATLTLITDISDVGTDTGLVRFVGKYLNSNKLKALRFLKLGLKVKLVAWLVVLVLGWFLAPFVSANILAKSELVVPLRLALVGVGGALLFSFATHAVQAVQRFWVWSGLNVAGNLVRLLVIIFLISLMRLHLTSGLVVYIAVPFLGFLAGLFFMPSFFKVKNEFGVAKEFFKYNKWVALFVLIAAVSSRLDTYISTRLISLAEVGIYSVAIQLAGIVPQIVFALASVVAPKLAGYDSDIKVKNYLKKLQVFTLGLALVGLIIGIPLSRVVIPLFYGNQYLGSVAPFAILLLAQAIFLISVPVHTAVFYYFGYPKLFFFIALGHLAIIGGLGVPLIGLYGYMGAAITVLVGNVFNFMVPAVWVVQKFRSRPK